MDQERKSLQSLLHDGYPDVLAAALALHPDAEAGGRFTRLFISLHHDTQAYTKALQLPSPDLDALERRRQQLLERMRLFLQLMGIEDYEVDAASLPGPVQPPAPEGARECILFLGSNPTRMGKLQLDTEFSTIYEQLQNSGNFVVKVSRATTRANIAQAIADNKPAIIHFAGHGVGEPDGFHKGGIVLEDPANRSRADILTAEAFSGLIETYRALAPVRLVILNACETAAHAETISNDKTKAVGMREEVGDGRAIAFAKGFYRGLEQMPDKPTFAYSTGLEELNRARIEGAAGVPVLW